MAHNLDITDGIASGVFAREDAWHQLGITLPDTFTAEEAMTHGKLGGWNVRKTPLRTADGSTNGWLEVPDKFAVVRDNPVRAGQVDVLGVVGKQYHPVQNEAHAEFLNALVDESGAHFETAGALDGGRQVFITMKIPSHIRIGGVDPVDTYLAAVNSHDGSLAFTAMPTPVRVVCQNTLNLAFRGAKSKFTVRHTSGAAKNIVLRARETLDLTFNYLDAFQAEAEQLINTTLTQARFEEIVAKEFGPAEDAPAATVTRCDNKLTQLNELFADAQTQEGIRDTAWAGLNAITEWADHFAPARGEDPDGARAQRAILDPYFKNRARDMMLALV